ncbi:MAG: tetratricopeptide repeat protein [Anaerolineaceae bacterium]|nr:tetratricopeptide repeat protein [Anaerolineaceae bacterium]
MVSPLSVKELRVVKNKAREFIKNRQIEKALIIYARILKLFPDDLESLLMLGDACLVRRDRDKAIKFYARAYELASWRKDIVRRVEIANEPLEEQSNTNAEPKIPSREEPIAISEKGEDSSEILLPHIIDKNQDSLIESVEIEDTQNIGQEFIQVEDPIVPETVPVPTNEEESHEEVAAVIDTGNKGLKNIPFDELVSSLPEEKIAVSKEELRKKIPIEQLRKKITNDDVENANQLMDQILKSKSPSTIVAEHLEDINDLLPALIELNIRQTRTQGRADLAEALEDILTDVLFDVAGFEEEDEKLITQPVNINLDSAPTIIIDGINSKESPFRLYHIRTAFQQAGFNVIGISDPDSNNVDLHSADYVLLHNPHSQQKFVKMLAERAGINKPTIVDFDIDFRKMPIHHPDYLALGMSSQDQYRSYTTVMQLADLITVASSHSSDGFISEGINSLYLPEMWNADNELWYRQSKSRATLNIGVMAITGQLSDIAEVRRGIVRIARVFPQTRLLITGDADAYRLFDNLAEERRAFYPDVEPDDYPYMLSQMDIILSPYEINNNNQHHSDRILMEAGIKQIPWIASPIAAYQKWNVGGILAETIDDWYFGLKKLILDPISREQLSAAGNKKALEREVKKVSEKWEQSISQLLEAV